MTKHRFPRIMQSRWSKTCGKWMGWPIRRVLSCGSVRSCSGGHPSTNAVAGALQRPTRTLGRAALKRVLSGLAPGGVYLAFPVTREAGGLLHHRFTLTRSPLSKDSGCWRSVLCGTCLRVTPSGRYPPPCPVEPGRSSSHLRDARPPGCPIRFQSTGGGASTPPPVVSDGADSASPFRRQDARGPRFRRRLAVP